MLLLHTLQSCSGKIVLILTLLPHDIGHEVPVAPECPVVLQGAEDEEGVVPEVVMHGRHPRALQRLVHARGGRVDDAVDAELVRVLPHSAAGDSVE